MEYQMLNLRNLNYNNPIAPANNILAIGGLYPVRGEDPTEA
jgi:hypothetical protein